MSVYAKNSFLFFLLLISGKTAAPPFKHRPVQLTPCGQKQLAECFILLALQTHKQVGTF